MAISIARHGHSARNGGPVAALRALVLSWRYAGEADGRDARLDLLRGFCVFAMVVNHIGGPSWLYAVTGGNVGPISAAEGFVFLSGLVLGLVYRRKIERAGLRAAIPAVLARARTLYGLTVGLTLLFALLTHLTPLALWVDRALWRAPESWPGYVLSVLLLRATWNGTDVLALYTLLLAATPLALVLLARGHAPLLLAGSASLWLAHQLSPAGLVIPWPIEHAGTFPFAAWQLLFFGAVALGYHRREVVALVERHPAPVGGWALLPRPALATAACGALLIGWAWAPTGAAAFVPGELVGGTFDPFSKSSLGIGRLVLFAAAIGLALAVVTVAWRPIERAFGWLLAPLGQASLYGYTVHLFLILLAYNVPPYVGGQDPSMAPHNTLGQLLLVLTLWAMVKRKVLFGLIPR
jgi:hypothetical protein